MIYVACVDMLLQSASGKDGNSILTKEMSDVEASNKSRTR